MSVKSGQSIVVLFTTHTASTGAAADATGTPAGTLYVNGTANGATVTVTNKTTGVYTAAVTLPSLTAGDVASLRVAATVSSVAGEGVIWQDVADTKRVSELVDLSAAAVNSEVDTALADYDPPTKAELDSAVSPLATAAALATVDGIVDDILVDTGTTLPGTLTTLGGYIDTEVASILAAVDTEVAAILADTNELQTNQGNWLTADVSALATAAALATVDTNVDAVLVDTNELQTNQGNWVTATGFSTLDAAGVRTAVGLAAADLDTQLAALPTATENADAVLSRDVANVEDTASVDSLAAIILAALHSSMSGTDWTIYKTDDATTFVLKALTVDADADPVTGAADV